MGKHNPNSKSGVFFPDQQALRLISNSREVITLLTFSSIKVDIDHVPGLLELLGTRPSRYPTETVAPLDF